MKNFLLLTILLAFILPAFPQGQSQSATVKTPKKYKKSVETGRVLIKDLMTKEAIPGFSVAVMKDGQFVWSEGFGYADLETRLPVTPQTRFRIGSLSKLLTAAAAAKLYEQGLLDPDAPVQKYISSFPKKEFEITPRQLLGHLAGIRHYKPDEAISSRRYESVADALKIFQDDALLHQPETKMLYSSWGFVLLSAAIEGAAKKDFLSLMQEQVFAPLKMTNTFPDDNKKIIESRSRFYSKNADKTWNNEVYADTSDRWAAGGFVSNAEDLASFGSQMLNDGFLKPETRNSVFTSQKLKDGKETGVGLAWRIGKDGKGRKIYHHGGASAGGRTFLLVYPESKISVALFCNLTFARFAESDAEKIAELFMN